MIVLHHCKTGITTAFDVTLIMLRVLQCSTAAVRAWYEHDAPSDPQMVWFSFSSDAAIPQTCWTMYEGMILTGNILACSCSLPGTK